MEERPAPTPEQKPEWLLRLEQESWQAELIISGIAIFGALSLPGLIERGLERAAFHAAEGELILWFLFFTYLIMASNALIIGFISHFILRALWIGLIGLASVYPQGVRAEHERYSRVFMERLRNKLPSPRDFNERLDQLCSILFAIIAGAVLLFGAISILLIFLFLAGRGMILLFPGLELMNVTLALLGLIVSLSMVVEAMNGRFLREKPWVEKVQFPIYWLSVRIFANAFYLPTTYIQWTFNSNIKNRQFTSGLFALLAVIGVVGIYNFTTIPNLPYIVPDAFHHERSRPYFQSVRNYETTREGHFAFEAAIPSEQVSGAFLPVFVPILGREQAVLDTLCGKWRSDDDLSRNENRRRRDDFQVACYRQYLQFWVNDSLYREVDLLLQNRTNPVEIGVRAFLPTDDFRRGKNLLRVEKRYYDEEGRAKIYTIPFWYSAE